MPDLELPRGAIFRCGQPSGSSHERGRVSGAKRCAERPGIVFEIRKYLDGRWELDSIFSDKAVAIEEANLLMQRRTSPLGIRVVAVREDGDKFREWTVFKRDKGEEERPEQRGCDARSAAPAGPATASRELYGGREACTDLSSDRRSLIFGAQMTFGFAVVFGAAALGFYLLRTIF